MSRGPELIYALTPGKFALVFTRASSSLAAYRRRFSDNRTPTLAISFCTESIRCQKNAEKRGRDSYALKASFSVPFSPERKVVL